MISDTLSDAHEEIREYLDEPFFANFYKGEMRAYVEKLMAEMDALRAYYDTEPVLKDLEIARTKVREAFASPVPPVEKESVPAKKKTYRLRLDACMRNDNGIKQFYTAETEVGATSDEQAIAIVEKMDATDFKWKAKEDSFNYEFHPSKLNIGDIEVLNSDDDDGYKYKEPEKPGASLFDLESKESV